jgi:hypothetical protein
MIKFVVLITYSICDYGSLKYLYKYINGGESNKPLSWLSVKQNVLE